MSSSGLFDRIVQPVLHGMQRETISQPHISWLKFQSYNRIMVCSDIVRLHVTKVGQSRKTSTPPPQTKLREASASFGS